MIAALWSPWLLLTTIAFAAVAGALAWLAPAEEPLVRVAQPIVAGPIAPHPIAVQPQVVTPLALVPPAPPVLRVPTPTPSYPAAPPSSRRSSAPPPPPPGKISRPSLSSQIGVARVAPQPPPPVHSDSDPPPPMSGTYARETAEPARAWTGEGPPPRAFYLGKR